MVGRGGNSGEEERVLQAIVLGDSFNERFMPITLDKPRCLLPLVNVPIIEYTLEFLAISGIQEVVLFCRSHADQLKAYIAQSRWSRPTSTLSVQIIVSPECASVGDALRDIDARQLIRGDFVLCYGDTVSTVHLGRILAQFRERRGKDKSLIMTMVTRRALPQHRSREHGEGAVFAIAGDECKWYRQVETEQDSRLDLPVELFLENSSLELRYDLLDCNIDICSLEVLALFTENFDYQDVRRDFVRGIMGAWELLGHKINVEVLEEEYAARVRNSALYDAISRDIIARWTFPIVPDSTILGVEGSDRVRLKHNSVYLGDVLLARTATIGACTVIGSGTSIGTNARITNSVIGKNCQIGADCIISNAYLWDGVIVEAGCHLEGCIISDRSRIKSNSTIATGCLITSEVIIGPKANLPPNTRVAKLSDRMEQAMQALGLGSMESLPQPPTTSSCLGKDSDGVVWEGESEDYNPVFSIGHLPTPRIHEDADDLSSTESVLSALSDSGGMAQQRRPSTSFEKEAHDLLLHCITARNSVDTVALELNALKFATNVGFADCRQAIITALWTLCEQQSMKGPEVAALFKTWCPLLTKFTHGPDGQIHLLLLLEREAITNESTIQVAHAIPPLYEMDVVEEDVIINWAENTLKEERLKQYISPFINFLQAESDDGEMSSESNSE